MYLNEFLGRLGTMITTTTHTHSKETTYDSDGFSPFECSYYQEPVIDDPENLEDRGFPQVPDSPFEQIPPFKAPKRPPKPPPPPPVKPPVHIVAPLPPRKPRKLPPAVPPVPPAPPPEEMCCVPLERVQDLAKTLRELADELDEVCKAPGGGAVRESEIS